MFVRQTVPYKKLDPLNFKKNQSKQRRLFCNRALAWGFGMLFMFIIMSLMIVKVASTTALNQSQPYQLRKLQNYSLSHNDIEEAEEEEDFDDIVTTATTTSPDSDNISVILKRNLTQTDFAVEAPAAELVKRSNIDEMRAKLQQLQLQQQQQYEQQQYEQMQQQQHLHAIAGETSYLLERADNNAELQPIYGTWRTKARRPQPSAMVALAAPSSSTVAVGALKRIASSSAITVGVGDSQQFHEFDKEHHSSHHYPHERHHSNHLYERLPKRSATMTPLKGELHDQMPRPPSLTTLRPSSSALVRRQYSETPGSRAQRDDPKPKPFHFPYDGPMPEQFKKAVGERPELHNIQDILQHLHISGGGIAPSKVPPQMVMMPTGLHIAGSFKNLKSSGIANFFRNKRNKKQMQLSIPIPMPMQLLQLQPSNPVIGAMAQPHQRIAIDQFYQYKPRSPQDINLLAMQHQIQSNASNQKKKKQKQKKQYGASNNFLIEHPSHIVADSYLPQFSPMFSLNATRPPNKPKRLPFKVNLDIYPVLPPTKDLRPFALEDAKQMQPSRPVSALRNPFSEYMQLPLVPSAAALTASSSHPQPIYGPFKFPSSAQTPLHLPQSSNMHVVFPDQASRYNQQHHHQQQLQQQQQQYQQLQQQQYQQQQHQQQQQQQQLQNYQQPKYPLNQYQIPFLPPDHVHPPVSSIDSQNNAKSNQILVHLNVFPKQKPPTTFKPSTNPFYNNFINRNTISEEPELPIDPRNLPEKSVSNSSNSHQQQLQQPQQQQQQYQQQQEQQLQQQQNQTFAPQQQPTISRSDRSPQDELIDFNHPIVAAELPQAAALTGNRLDNSESILYDHIDTQNNFRYNNNANIDQIASEAQTASLFRFPVEDLIQFQVDDAL